MLLRILKNIYKKLSFDAVNGIGNERMPLNRQRAYLSTFPDPGDDYQRSFYKYKCFAAYCYYDRRWLLPLYNLGAMVVYPFFYRKLISNGKKMSGIWPKVDAVIENVPRLPNTDVIPEKLVSAYKEKVEIPEINYFDGILDEKATAICRELRKRYFRNFYFRLICMIKLAQYNAYIVKYRPEAIVFYSCEREFAGPLQTMLCEDRGVRYESYMHGDYLYAIGFAFMRYSRYYIWDESYRQMFKALRCVGPMEVYMPEKLKGIAQKIEEKECSYFATYYFSAETRECAEAIRAVFDDFRKAGLRCKIRPHPRYSDMEMLEEVFSGYTIENCREYTLADSITDSLYTVGLNTTVLSQAYFSGKDVVIDDISMRQDYKELKKRGYVMMKRPHLLLSALREEIKNTRQYDDTYRFFIPCEE